MQELNQKEIFTGITIICQYKKDNSRFFRNVRGCNTFFKGFPVLMVSSLRQVLQIYSERCIFCSAVQYIVSRKQPVGSAHEVLAESLETVFDEAHFIVNLHDFLQSLALPMDTFPPNELFVPRQNNFQNSSPLQNSLVCIFPSILNHRQANQNNSIIKDWQQVEILNVFSFCHQKTIKNRQALH